MASYGNSQNQPPSTPSIDPLMAARVAAAQKLSAGIPAGVLENSENYSFLPTKVELLGYTTAAFIFLFGALGTLFSDTPDIGGIKKNIAGAYMVGAVHIVLLSAIVGNTNKKNG